MRQNEYSELRIVTSKDLLHRSFISFYFNGKRVKEYNGKNLGLIIQPNYAKSIAEKNKLLKKLEFELQKALEEDNYPSNKIPTSNNSPKITSTIDLLSNALKSKLNSNLSKFYKRNLISIHKKFIEFLTTAELNSDLKNLTRFRVEQFLSQYSSSGTYYMNKRRDLGVLLSQINKDLDVKITVVKDTDRRKSKAKLHKIYEPQQIKPILDYLQENNPNLHLCCLLCYGCFLRPHEEIRNLFKHHFKKNNTEIHLSGDENKGGRIRVVHIPNYVQEVLKVVLPTLKEDDNIFTAKPYPFNDAYFNTAWTRAWLKMHKLNIIQQNQTVYSFRHTAAVNVYRKTKDLNILQQLLGHSDMIVTLKYLRGLGEATNEELRNVMPEL